MNEFQQNDWNAELVDDLRSLLAIALHEDQHEPGDLTSRALIPESASGAAVIRARETGIVAGLRAVPFILEAVDKRLLWEAGRDEGAAVGSGEMIGVLRGPVRSLLAAERLVLNLLGRLSGIATLTRHYVDAVHGTEARIYDTRKTTLGWRRLEKYAVRCGGGRNHRTGLFDAVLIKDNHLAYGSNETVSSEIAANQSFTPAESIRKARLFLERTKIDPRPLLEIEVDSLKQLAEVLPEKPDIVLLDNMPPSMLREAVELRTACQSMTQLEASGGITLQTVRTVAESGVERISVGALTHSAVALDFGLDWDV